MNITKGKVLKPQRVVIYGPEGIGKTTFASQFPNPIFIDPEGSTDHLDVARTDKPSSWTMLKQQLGYIKTNPQLGFQTVVIDTADWAERLCIENICAEKRIESLGGANDYGKSYNMLYLEFGRFLDFLSECINSGLNIVLAAHSTLKKFEQPDEIGSYDRYELKLEKKTAQMMKEWADMVLFANYKTLVTEIDGKKKATGGQRVMYTSHRPNWDAKNRHGIADELPFTYQSIAHCIPVMQQQAPVEIKQQQPAAQPAQQPIIDQSIPADLQPAPDPTAQVKPVTPVESAALTQLRDLMKMDNISEDQIKQLVASQGYYPIQTPIEIWEEEFFKGKLIANWPAIVAYIHKQK